MLLGFWAAPGLPWLLLGSAPGLLGSCSLASGLLGFPGCSWAPAPRLLGSWAPVLLPGCSWLPWLLLGSWAPGLCSWAPGLPWLLLGSCSLASAPASGLAPLGPGWPGISCKLWDRGLGAWNFSGCRRLNLEKPFLPKGRWPGKPFLPKGRWPGTLGRFQTFRDVLGSSGTL